MKKVILTFIVTVAALGMLTSQNRRTTTTATPAVPSTTKTSTPANTETSKKAETSSTESGSKNSFLTPSSPISKMSTTIEFGGYPSDADVSFINVYGLLGLNFDIAKRRLYFGPFFRYKILSTTDYQIMPVGSKNLDLSSFNEWGAGLNFGAHLPLGRTLLLAPELRFGYNEYNIQDLTYTKENKNFLNHSYLSFTPRLNVGFKLSDYTIMNFSGGYILPYYLRGGEKTGAYNPSTFMYGLGIRFYLPQ